MARHQTSQAVLEHFDLPITLCSKDGTILHTFPSEVVSSMRHLENTLVYRNTIPKTIAMVSALSGEGVTYSSLAFAATLANDMQTNTCLVELNWHRPGLCKIISQPVIANPIQKRSATQKKNPTVTDHDFGLGIAGVLTSICPLEDAIISTSMPNLSFIPAGNLDPLLRPSVSRSELLQHTLSQLGEHFEHIIIDIPAVHISRDATALAALSQGCCLVIRQGVTPINSVKHAIDEVAPLNILGVILNQVKLSSPSWLHRFVPQE